MSLLVIPATAPGGGAFSPLDIPWQFAWWYGADGGNESLNSSNAAAADTETVTKLIDQLPGIYATNSAGSAILQTANEGVYFGGAASMDFGNVLGEIVDTAAFEMMMVLDLSGASDSQRAFELNGAGGYIRVVANATAGSIQAVVSDGADKTATLSTDPSGLHLVGARYARSGSVIVSLDGTDSSPTSVGTTATVSTSGGRLMASRINSNYTTGVVKALFVIARTLTTAERSKMVAWAQSAFSTP